MKNTTEVKKGSVTENIEDLDFDDFFPGSEDFGEGGSNPRCLWDGSICNESVTHQITWGFYGGPEVTVEAETYCRRHYAMSLLDFVFFHEDECPISLAEHIKSYGAL